MPAESSGDEHDLDGACAPEIGISNQLSQCVGSSKACTHHRTQALLMIERVILLLEPAWNDWASGQTLRSGSRGSWEVPVEGRQTEVFQTGWPRCKWVSETWALDRRCRAACAFGFVVTLSVWYSASPRVLRSTRQVRYMRLVKPRSPNSWIWSTTSKLQWNAAFCQAT